MNPNDIIGKYRLVRYIGSGTFGEVWEAEDIHLGVSVALKFYVALDESGQNEFKTEYYNTHGLSHRNLLTVKTYDFHNNRPYLVMDLCHSGSVENLCGSMTDEREIWRFIRDVASGLAYLHEKDIVHQDIKPANILINTSGDYVISDFGISRNLRATMRKQSKRQGNKSSGSISYMAPERFSSDPIPVKASDIWSVGASVYELVTGTLPFGKFGGSVQNAGAGMPDLPQTVSPALKKVIYGCLQKETWERFPAEKLECIAQKALDGEVIFDEDNEKKPITDKKKIKRFCMAAAVLLVVLFAAIILVRFLGGRSDTHMKKTAHYEQLIDECRQIIDSSMMVDNSEKIGCLLRAKDKRDEILLFESQNTGKIACDEAETVLETLDSLLRFAAEDWAEAAKAQENLNWERTVKCYELSLQLYESFEVRKKYEHYLNRHGSRRNDELERNNYADNINSSDSVHK